MIPRIEVLSAKRLIGKSLVMSLAQNKTAELWRSFMMNRKSIVNAKSNDLYSIQIYPPVFDWTNFSPSIIFEKWAAIEVDLSEPIPEGFNEIKLAGGQYAVFSYKGSSNEGEKVFSYIFGEWLPGSGFMIDDRPHFEVLGEKYKNGDPDSEEEIWIPIK